MIIGSVSGGWTFAGRSPRAPLVATSSGACLAQRYLGVISPGARSHLGERQPGLPVAAGRTLATSRRRGRILVATGRSLTSPGSLSTSAASSDPRKRRAVSRA